MAKRYYQSVKDRLSESRGMERRMIGEEYYASFEDSKRQQLQDSGMIQEDRRQVANLPQEVIMKPWVRTDYAEYDLDDTQRVINRQIDEDIRGMKRERSSRKY